MGESMSQKVDGDGDVVIGSLEKSSPRTLEDMVAKAAAKAQTPAARSVQFAVCPGCDLLERFLYVECISRFLAGCAYMS